MKTLKIWTAMATMFVGISPLAAVAGDIYVVTGQFTIGKYTTSGATVNPFFISGLNWPTGIAISGDKLFVLNNGNGTIGEYTTSGATVNPSLITGIPFLGAGPFGLTVSGDKLFVSNFGANANGGGFIGEYTTSGATINPSLITGLNGPFGMVVSDDKLFVANNTTGVIGEYTTSGATVNPSLINTGFDGLDGIAISGNDLFVVHADNGLDGMIGKYTTSGATLNTSFITGLNYPSVIALHEGHLFVATFNSGHTGGVIGEYDAATGATINASLLATPSTDPEGLLVVPEPSSLVLAGLGLVGLVSWSWRKRRNLARLSST